MLNQLFHFRFCATFNHCHQLAVAVFLAGLMTADACSAAGTERPTFRPEDYGAKGDGVHDDTKAIQKAIDLAAATEPDQQGRRGTVVLDNTYFVTRQVPVIDQSTMEHGVEKGPHFRALSVTSGVTIRGRGTVTLLEGGRSSRTHMASYTYAFWISESPFYGQTPKNTPKADKEVCDVTLSGISIENDPAAFLATYTESGAIIVVRGRRVNIDGVRMRHWYRGIAATQCHDCRVTNCTVEDTRYIGIAFYFCGGDAKERNLIAGNRLIGNTQLSGGVYVHGANVEVRDNHLTLTNGIFAEAFNQGVIEGNQIERSPYGIRVGYLASGGASDVEVRRNDLHGCVSGIMIGNAERTIVAENRVDGFLTPHSDFMIEPPNGYWGYGRDPVGINVVDCREVVIESNHIAGLNKGVPVGIRVANSHFVTDVNADCFAVVRTSENSAADWNSGNVVRNNDVSGQSGDRIGYYLENQIDVAFVGNRAKGTLSNRVISSTGQIDGNQCEGGVCVVEQPTTACRRLVFENHPAHWKSPGGGTACPLTDAQLHVTEFFPPRPDSN
jgi:parallel beta-helix repeat protein